VWADELDEATALAIVRERFPDLASGRFERIRDGWDTHAFLIDEAWVARVPRRATAEAALRQEVGLLARLDRHLPSPVPQVERVSAASPTCIVTRRIAGNQASGHRQTAVDLGRFLASLHALPVESLPVPPTSVGDWRAAHEQRLAQFEEHVFPLLDADERHSAKRLFASVEFDFDPTLVHGDLGPEHVLCTADGHIAGVIDWGDARVGDPAIDLAWALYGVGRAFAAAVTHAYGDLQPAVRARAAFYHRRGPWYQVLYGLERGRTELVRSGLTGLRERLALKL
jgi:aminoglycoside phosphotransferase (APT) family kinase protein